MLRETAAFRQGHREVLLSLILAIVKDLDDVRMIKLGDGLSFAVKAFELGWRRQNAAANGLQGHQAAELGVAGLVNDSHGPAAELSENLVTPKGAEERREIRRGRRQTDRALLVQSRRRRSCGVGASGRWRSLSVPGIKA